MPTDAAELTMAEAAKHLGCSPSWLSTLLKRPMCRVRPVGMKQGANKRPARLYRFGELRALLDAARERGKRFRANTARTLAGQS